MKKQLIIAIWLAPATLMAQKITYTIKGNVGPLNSPAKAYLSYRTDAGNVTDSAAIDKGLFLFKGSLPYALKANLVIAHHGEDLRKLRTPDALPIYLETAEISVKGTDSIYNASISGSQLNKTNLELTKALKPYNDQVKKLSTAYRALPKEQKDEKAEAAYEKNLADIGELQKSVLAPFIKAHPNSLVSLDALKTYGGYFPEASEVEPLYNLLSAQVKNSVLGQQYGKWLQGWKATALNAQAPLFAQNDKNGNAVSLSSFKGKYVLVDFWASWCGPCRRENPNVVKTFSQYKDKNFTILGVSLDNNRDAWLKAIDDDQLNWTQVSDLKFWKNEVAELYGVRAIPQNFLLNPEGKIIAKNLTGDKLAAKLQEIYHTGTTAKAEK